MKLAAAQVKPVLRDTGANIQNHIRLVELAAAQEVSVILFPEMLLTGYERELAGEYAFSAKDERLAGLRKRAVKHNMVIIAGAPVKMGPELYIGAFVLLPSRDPEKWAILV